MTFNSRNRPGSTKTPSSSDSVCAVTPSSRADQAHLPECTAEGSTTLYWQRSSSTELQAMHVCTDVDAGVQLRS